MGDPRCALRLERGSQGETLKRCGFALLIRSRTGNGSPLLKQQASKYDQVPASVAGSRHRAPAEGFWSSRQRSVLPPIAEAARTKPRSAYGSLTTSNWIPCCTDNPAHAVEDFAQAIAALTSIFR